MTSTTAPVRRGSRIALTPAAIKEPVHDGQVYLVTGRDLRFEGRMVPAGVEIPGAHGWYRVDAWVNARRIRLSAPGEDFTPYAEWVTPHLEAEAIEAERQAVLAAEALEAERLAALTAEELTAEQEAAKVLAEAERQAVLAAEALEAERLAALTAEELTAEQEAAKVLAEAEQTAPTEVKTDPMARARAAKAEKAKQEKQTGKD